MMWNDVMKNKKQRNVRNQKHSSTTINQILSFFLASLIDDKSSVSVSLTSKKRTHDELDDADRRVIKREAGVDS